MRWRVRDKPGIDMTLVVVAAVAWSAWHVYRLPSTQRIDWVGQLLQTVLAGVVIRHPCRLPGTRDPALPVGPRAERGGRVPHPPWDPSAQGAGAPEKVNFQRRDSNGSRHWRPSS